MQYFKKNFIFFHDISYWVPKKWGTKFITLKAVHLSLSLLRADKEFNKAYIRITMILNTNIERKVFLQYVT